MMADNQLILENFGGVDANSLCQLLNNTYDNDHPDDEPNIVQMSSYYDDDSLNNLFRDKKKILYFEFTFPKYQCRILST